MRQSYPVVESPSEPASIISGWLRTYENAYFGDKCKIVTKHRKLASLVAIRVAIFPSRQ